LQGRTKEKQYTFDHVFGKQSTNADVFTGTVEPILLDVVTGINATVFAYGATGSGKTHTMLGSSHDPGLMVRALERVFWELERRPNFEAEVTCSYLEVYNEVRFNPLLWGGRKGWG
jgi:kinesin family protein 18/19